MAIWPPEENRAVRRLGSALLGRLRNFGWLSAEQIVRLGLGFIFTLMLADHLGPAGFGAYGYILGLVALFAPFAAYGLDPLITKRAVAEPKDAWGIFLAAMALRLPGALLAFGLAVGAMALLPDPPQTSMALVAIAGITLLAMPWHTPGIILIAFEKVKQVALPRLAVSVGIFAAMVWAIWQGGSIATFLWLRAIEAVLFGIVTLVALLAVLRGSLRSRAKAFSDSFRDFLRNGFPLFLSSLAVIAYMRIDQVMLGQLSSIDELGLYTVAVRFSDSALFVPMALYAAMFPSLIKAHDGDEKLYRSALQRFFDLMSVTMWGVTLGVVAVGWAAIGLLLDDSFSRSVGMLAVLSLTLPFVGLGVARSAHLTIKSWFWTSPLTTVMGAILNIALNFLLIPKYGGYGAAVASVISYWLAAHGTCFMLPWLRDIGRDLTRSLEPVSSGMRLRRRSNMAGKSNV